MDDLTEEELDLLEPAPDIHTLFVHYNKLYFEAKLGACSVEWSSSRMTSCGGTCELVGGGAGGARIKLSEPLLKLRPTRDLKEVLLHEMTHAYMMLQGIRDDDRGGHGTIFKSIIQRINTSRLPDHQRPPGGYNVAVYHTMLAEVDHYRQHHWQCERCGNLVKRAMNRPPQEADCRGRMGRGADCRDPDCRFHMHQKHCGGVWIKVKEPEGYQQKGKKRAAGDSSAASANNNSSSASNPGGSRSSGTRPDGVPLPAKRPKKGGSGLPASAAAGTRAITDYFGGSRRGKQTGAEAAAAAVHGQVGEAVLPALQAVAGAGPAAAAVDDQQGLPAAAQQQAQAQQQQQQVQQAQQIVERQEPSAEERRRLQAEAAMRRLAGAAGNGRQLGAGQQPQQQEQQQAQQQQQQQQQPEPGGHGGQAPRSLQQQHRQQPVQAGPQEPQEVVDLLDSPPAAASGRHVSADALPPQQGMATADASAGAQGRGYGSSGRAPEAGGGSGASGSSSEGTRLECPVCGRQWVGAAISNAELNAHIDECLNASFL